MNLKTAKAIRKMLRPQFMQFGMTERSAVHETITVRSGRRRYSVTIYAKGGIEFSHDFPEGGFVVYEPEKVLKETALQVRLMVGCPKQQYKRIKASFQAYRNAR